MKDDVKKITIGGEERSIKMTYGLLNEMCNLAGEAEDALLFNMNKELRAEALRLLLSERDKEGVIKKDFNLFLLEADPDDILELLDWAGTHVLDFFLKAATKAKAVADDRKDLLSTLSGGAS